MRTDEYTKIINSIDEMTKRCREVIEPLIACGHDLSALTLYEVNTAIEESRKLQSEMDLFVKSDMYHIVGAGNLSASQSSHFTKKCNELLFYRTDVKRLAVLQQFTIPKFKEGKNVVLHSGVKIKVR